MKDLINRLRSSHRLHKACHGSHEGLHFAYFALAFVEGHGLYAYVAGSLFVVTIVQSCLYGEGE